MNINFGLFPNLSNEYKKIDKRLKRNFISQNARSKITEWSNKINEIIR